MARDLFKEAGIQVDEGRGTGGARDLFKEAGITMKPQSRGITGVIRDIGVTGLKGAIALPQAAVGLLDIPTLGRVGRVLEGAGYRPHEAQQIAEGMYTPQQQAANRAVAEADGFLPTVKAAVENPSAIAVTAGESLPSMVAGGLVGRGVAAVSKIPPWLAGGVGEGALGAGSAASEIRNESPDRVLTPGQSAAALGSGAGTLVLGAAGGKLAHSVGLADVDTLLAGGKLAKSPAGFVKQVLGAGISEGVFEELPQSMQEQMWQNFATGKPVMDGVGNAAAMGMLSGAAMGGLGGGFNAALAPRDGAGGPAPAVASAATPEVHAPIVETPRPAERALFEPMALTPLDQVDEIHSELQRVETRMQELSDGAAYGPSFDPERQQLGDYASALAADLQEITGKWPKATIGAPASFSTEAGVKLAGHYALMDADDLVSSHDENMRANFNYPQELQPRDRTRDASEAQVSGIVQRLDPARLGMSADVATGAPIVGADGLVESGNGRTIALRRVYQANGQKADDYREFLRSNASQFGIDPADVDRIAKPVLVRVRETPVNRAEFARQANASTVQRMSPSEQAMADAKRLKTLAGLESNESGDFSASHDFIKAFMAAVPDTERAELMDEDGRLSSAGYRRIQSAILARAYGNSPTLRRMTESMDDNVRNVSKALTRVAPTIAAARDRIDAGDLHGVDISHDLLQAVEALATLKGRGWTVEQELGQGDLTGPKYSPEVTALMRFLDENARSPRRIAEFLARYYEAVEALGSPAQASMFSETQVPSRTDLLEKAKGTNDGDGKPEGAKPAREDRGESEAAPGRRGRAEGDEAAGTDPAGQQQGEQRPEWVAFGPESGTLGIPRAEMPQIKAEHRSALAQFLRARGIDYEREEVSADTLKPTQAEYSPQKVERSVSTGQDGERSVLVAADGHILDGHHQWMAHQEEGTPVPVLRFDAPIRDLLAAAAEFPSTASSAGAAPTMASRPALGIESRNEVGGEGASDAAALDRRVERIRSLVQSIVANWANAPEVQVVATLSDPAVPAAALRHVESQEETGASVGVEGFWHKGKVFLVADHLPTEKDTVRALFHEALGHAGLRGTFGPHLDAILDRLGSLNSAAVKAKAKQYGIDFDDLKARREAAEEVLAEMAQSNPSIGWVRQAIAAIRGWLREHVSGFEAMQFSDDELISSFIVPARRFVREGASKGEVAIGSITPRPAAAMARSPYPGSSDTHLNRSASPQVIELRKRLAVLKSLEKCMA